MSRISQLVRPARQHPDESEREQFTRMRDWIAVHTTFLDGVGLRVQRERLDDEQVAELVKLTGRISGGEKVGKNALRRFEHLVEVASGREPGSVFAPARDAETTAMGFAKLANLAGKKRRPRMEQEDAVVIPAGVTHALRDGLLDGVDLLVLYRLLAAQAGVLASTDEVEDGKLIGWEGAFLAPIDPDGVISGLPFAMKERLRPGGWIIIESRGGGKVAVGPGSRLVAALKQREKPT